MSRTTAREITIPDAAATPWTKRSALNISAEVTVMHRNEVAVNTAMPISRGRLRPHWSLSGPSTNWPRASPTMTAVSVSWIWDSAAFRSAAISGNAGR